MTKNQQVALLTAPLGGALLGAIGASVAKHSRGFPITKAALATGLIDGAAVALLVKLVGGVNTEPSNEEVLRWGAVGAMTGSAVGAIGAAASDPSKTPILTGALAGGAIALLFTGARVTAEGWRPQLTDNATLSGWEMFP